MLDLNPNAPPPLDYSTAAPPRPPGRSPVRRMLVLFGVIAGLAAIPMGGLLLLVWSLSSPPSAATFDVRNDTGQPMVSFALSCRGRTAQCGPLAVGQTASLTLPTIYKAPYTYVAALADDRSFAGTAARWGDEDDRGPWRSFKLSVEIKGGPVQAYASGNRR